jgi:hypothetical protein
LYSAPKKKPEEIKLIKNDKNNKLYQIINAGYKFVYIVSTFTRKLLWFGSCLAFMYLLPMSFEIFTEQQRILQKIQMQMMNDSMMGGPMDAPQMRPF